MAQRPRTTVNSERNEDVLSEVAHQRFPWCGGNFVSTFDTSVADRFVRKELRSSSRGSSRVTPFCIRFLSRFLTFESGSAQVSSWFCSFRLWFLSRFLMSGSSQGPYRFLYLKSGSSQGSWIDLVYTIMHITLSLYISLLSFDPLPGLLTLFLDFISTFLLG